MGNLCHLDCYPGIPGSPDSDSPIPDEYAYRYKADETNKQHSSGGVYAEAATGLYSFYNEYPFDQTLTIPEVMYVYGHPEI
jgi:hypothetical protein